MLIENEIEIENSSPERVFEILTDLEKYKEWNPFVIDVSGTCKENEIVKVTVFLDKELKMEHRIEKVGEISFEDFKKETQTETITKFEKCLCFKWRDYAWWSSVADGVRTRYIYQEGEKVKVKVILTVSGLFSGLVKLMYIETLKKAQTKEMEALKKRCENEN